MNTEIIYPTQVCFPPNGAHACDDQALNVALSTACLCYLLSAIFYYLLSDSECQRRSNHAVKFCNLNCMQSYYVAQT